MDERLKSWITKHRPPVAVAAILLGVGALLFAGGVWLSTLAGDSAHADRFPMQLLEIVGVVLVCHGG